MERGHLSELRHDFRAIYGVRYEDVPIDEALDLILTLPKGSLYVSARYPELSWTEHREAIADLQDTILRCFLGPEARVTRPADIVARSQAAEKAKRVKERIEGTRWVAE